MYCGYRMRITSRDSYIKTQEVHDSQSFARRIQLQLITFAMTFVGARFALALSISIPRFYPAWAGVSVSVLHFSGKWESIWRTLLRNCSWQHALCLYVPERHRVIPLVSHSGGSNLRAFLSPSRSPKRALFHCPQNIFTTACAMCRYLPCLPFSVYRDRRISIIRWATVHKAI